MNPLDPAARGAFYALSRLRRRRIFHPHGVGFEARLRPHAGAEERFGLSLLEAGGDRAAVVRLSRGAGLPAPLPDLLGLALRVNDAYGEGQHQDFLLASSGSAPLLRHALLPGPRGFFRHVFSSILPYRAGTQIVIVGARGAGAGASPADLADLRSEGSGHAFELCLATPLGNWDPVARLELGDILDDDTTEALRFNPWNSGGGLRPTGPLMGLRDPAYRGSQEGRADVAGSGVSEALAEGRLEGLRRGADGAFDRRLVVGE